MSPGTLSTIIIVAFFVFLVVGIVSGFLKGAIKSTVDIIIVLLCAILALPITKGITSLLVSSNALNLIADKLLGLLPSDAGSYVESVKEYLANEATAEAITDIAELVISLPTILLSPIIFIIIFAALGVIGFIIGFILKLLLCPKTKKIGWRILGSLLSAGACVLVFSVVLIPVVGYSNFASTTAEHCLEVIEANKENEPQDGEQNASPDEGDNTNTDTPPDQNQNNSEDLVEAVTENEPIIDESTSNNQSPSEIGTEDTEEPSNTSTEKDTPKLNIDLEAPLKAIIKYSAPLKDNFVSKVVYAMGGRGIYNSLTTNEVASTKIALQTEVNGIIDLCDVALKFLDTEPKHYSAEQSDAVNKANEALENSEYLPLLLSKVISFAANEYYQGNDLFGIEKPDFGKDFNPTFDKVLRVLKDTDSNDIRKDLRTISNIANGALETGIIDEVTSEEINIWHIVENKDMIEIILVELYKNTRTRNMIPYITSALTNYVYDMYDDINGTNTDPGKFDYTNYNEQQLAIEAIYIASAVKEIHSFLENTDLGEDFDPKEVIMTADLGALGRGLEYLRDGIFTDRVFKVLLHAVLRSEAISETGIVDDGLINSAERENADLEGMLVARQNIMKLAIAIQEKKEAEETKDLMDSVIESILKDDDESLGTIVNKDNLTSLGMKESDAESIEGIVSSILDGADNCEFETEEEKQQEIEKAEEIISAVGNTVLDKTEDNMFTTEENETSTTDMTAKEFVDSVTDSKLTSSMIQSATRDENGEEVSDPYKIQKELSDTDKEEISNAINESYAQESLTEEDKATLEALAIIFGVTIQK